MKLSKKHKRVLDQYYQQAVRENPGRSEAAVKLIAVRKFKKYITEQEKKKTRKKAAGSRRRNSKGEYSTGSGKSVFTTSGGKVSPR